jgi:hypothetical protein
VRVDDTNLIVVRRRVQRVLLIGGVMAGLALAASPALGAQSPETCNGQKSLCSRHFNRVVLPGTHNSMSAKSLGWTLPNQQVAIPAQLKAGVRALLIDTHYGQRRDDGVIITDDNGTQNVGPRDVYLCHEFCEIGASRLVPQLEKIKVFLKKNPDNVLLLDVEDHITSQDFSKAMRDSGLVSRLYKGTPGPKWPTLKSMIKSRQQVVVLAEHDGGGGAYPWLHTDYDGIVQETPYTFQQQDELTNPSNWPASCVPNRGGTTGSLFLMNHWSPPTPPVQADPAQYEALNAKSVLVGRARQCASDRGLLPTIVAVDQFSYGDLFAAVKRLNVLEGDALSSGSATRQGVGADEVAPVDDRPDRVGRYGKRLALAIRHHASAQR